MFETLSEKLNGIFYKLGNKGRLTEKDIDTSLREVRMALLEADVNFRVARQLASTIKERALAEDLLTKLTPRSASRQDNPGRTDQRPYGRQPQARESHKAARRHPGRRD